MDKRAHQGFTLYELLITVVIVGIIIAFGVPNLRQFQLNNRMIAATNDLLAAFSLARTEAIKRKTNVTVCATDEWQVAAPACGARDAANITWHEGFVVFTDADGDLVIDAADNDTVLRVGGPPSGNDTADPADPNNIKIVTNNGSEFFSFRATGFGRGDLFGEEALTAAFIYDYRGNSGPAGGDSSARMLVVSPAGRAQMYRETDFINQICADADFNLACP